MAKCTNTYTSRFLGATQKIVAHSESEETSCKYYRIPCLPDINIAMYCKCTAVLYQVKSDILSSQSKQSGLLQPVEILL